MGNPIHENTTDKKTILSWKELFVFNDRGLRCLIGLIALFVIALFLHFREVRVELLELNAIAGRYVVAQVDFEFPDDESTIILREKVLNSIGTIYKINEDQLQEARLKFENMLVEKAFKEKREEEKYIEQMNQAADVLEELLANARFTDNRTIQKMKELGLSVSVYLPFSSLKGDKTLLQRNYWRDLKTGPFDDIEKRKPKGMNVSDIEIVIDFFKKESWKLLEANEAQVDVKNAIQKAIPTRFSKVKAGTKIIGQGEKIAPRHLAMMQAMKQSLAEERNLWAPITIFGSLLLALIIVVLGGIYFYVDQPKIFCSLRKISLVVCIVILTIAFGKVVEYILMHNPNNLIEAIRYPIILPFSALLFSTLVNTRVSLFITSFLCILFGIVLAFDHNRFMFVNFIASLVIILSTQPLRRRTEVFAVCGKALIGTIPTIFAYNFISNRLWSKALSFDIGSSITFLLIIAIIVVGLLPLLESLFNVMTDITLMEYMDPNNELMRRLTLEVPGTYQHCLVLGNIAEASAQAIGANGLFCRVATLYHDIGKLNNSHYFTENQQGGVNIHQLLTPAESAQVIISHVRDGVILAKKYRLPQSFIDIIKEHHGTTLVYYFYCKELELKGGDATSVDESLFRYTGPKPHSKESAILMLTDAVEAASRSLDFPTEDALAELVNRVVSDRTEDGQLDECCLTFEELEIVKKTILKTLLIICHVRIKYPEKKEKKS